jgi:hypothetical protein
VLTAKGLEAAVIDVERWSDVLSGTVVVVFSKDESGQLSHVYETRYLRFGNKGIDPESVLEAYSGNRLTVNGFLMKLPRSDKIFGEGQDRLAVAFDVETRGDKGVEFDIARTRLVGPGRHTVAEAMQSAVHQGLRDLGIFDRLGPTTRDLVDGSWKARRRRTAPVKDRVLLDRVARLMPKGVWPTGVHKSIAEQLMITNTLAARAITTLIQTGRIDPEGRQKDDG